MSRQQPPGRPYVDQIRDDTRRYVQELLDENERLRTSLAGVEAERTHLEAELAAVSRERQRVEAAQECLQQRLAAAEREKRGFCERFVEIERRNNDLANLYVASYGLHGSLERREILTTLQEIIINLVGSEELAIFEVAPGAERLELAVSTGIDPEPWRTIPLGHGCIGRCAAEGHIWLRGAAGACLPEESDLTACVPLVLDGAPGGAIAIFRLLEQKPDIAALDREIFELLSNQAAVALYCAALHARFGRGREP